MVILTPNLLISVGTRDTYRHPQDPCKCLKIEKTHAHYSKRRKRFYDKNLSHNELDLKNYSILKPHLIKYIPYCEDTLVETNLGKAFCSELIVDQDQTPSECILDYLLSNTPIPDQILSQLTELLELIRQKSLFIFDLNPKNFLIKKSSHSQYHLKFIDFKSLNLNKSLIPMEKIPIFARGKLKRRIKRLKKWINHSENQEGQL